MRIWFNAGYSQTRDAILLIRQAAQERQMPVTIVASHARLDAPARAAADIDATEPDKERHTPEGRMAYARWCLDFATAQQIDIFFAQRGRSAVQEIEHEFAAIGCKLVVAAPAATLDIIENKARFYEACADANLPTPVSIPVTDVDGYRDACETIKARGFDVCVKPSFGVFGSGYFRIVSEGSFFRQLMHIDDRVILHEYMASAIAGAGSISPFLVMQHLPGTEWSVDCLCDNGRILTGFVRSKRKHSQLIDANPVLMDLAARVAAEFNLSNLVNIQFKSASKDEDNPYILEINPRMSGGCSYGALAGVNLPWLQFLHASGQLTPADLPVVRPTLAATVSQAIDITSAGGVARESHNHA